MVDYRDYVVSYDSVTGLARPVFRDEARLNHFTWDISVDPSHTGLKDEDMPTSIHHQLEPVDPAMLSDALTPFLMYDQRQQLYRRLLARQEETLTRAMHASELIEKKDEFRGRTVKYGFIQGVLTDAGRNLAGDSSHDIVLVLNGQLFYVGSTHTITVLPKES